MKLKHLLTAGVICLAACSAAADTGAYCSVMVTDSEGETTLLDLGSTPTVEYVGDNIVITAASTTVTYPKTATLKLTFSEKSSSGVTTAISDKAQVIFRITDSIEVSGLRPGAAVGIYTLSGVNAGQGIADSTGSLTLPLPGAKGIYVVSTPTVSNFKFVVK